VGNFFITIILAFFRKQNFHARQALNSKNHPLGQNTSLPKDDFFNFLPPHLDQRCVAADFSLGFFCRKLEAFRSELFWQFL
jgi:hypothetical protein